MSYQDDNNWQILTPKLNEEYREKAAKRLDHDYQECLRYIIDNNLEVYLSNPRDGEDFEQSVYYIAEKMWKADGYYDPPSWFIRPKDIEAKLAKEILPCASQK
jgi:hypothetical protein